MAKTKKSTKRGIEAYAHSDKERVNNPPVGLVTPDTDKDTCKKTYAHDPHLDPQLQWAGKAEHTSFEVPTVSLHVHERIAPRTIVEAVRKHNGTEPQMSLFAAPEENPPIRQAIEFYKHRHNWTNRLIAGDSLLVMNSLLEKEGLGGQVQTIYIDPPYGIRYGSNFQPFVNRNEVNDRDDDLTAEPEQIRAFRDTWELGIHSYLTYLRDRLLLARELLVDSVSCFVQIGDENVHRVSMVMDEVFGAENRMATITYATSGGSSASALPEVADYLLWYGKHKEKTKYRQLYLQLSRKEVVEQMNWDVMVELADGECRSLTPQEKADPERHLPSGARLYQRAMLTSQNESRTGRSEPYEVAGRTYPCPRNRHWCVSKKGLDRLYEFGRLDLTGQHKRLAWKNYEEEIPGKRLNNIWSDLARSVDKRYVVQTADKILQRCILMTSDPGDLIFDQTCGSGTAAFAAEEWGRRWITCDTSRVALTLTKQRLTTANFAYYELAHPDEGVGAGFLYRSVATVSARTLGYDEPPNETMLYDQPRVDKTKTRVTGPFTVEAVPAPAVKPLDEIVDSEEGRVDGGKDAGRSSRTTNHFTLATAREGETLRQGDWRDELLKTGIRGKAGQRISFARLEPMPGTRWLHAEGETRPDSAGADRIRDGGTASKPERAVVSFGPDHAPMEQRQIALAIEEAQTLVPKPTIIIFAAFQFDPEASKDIDETNWPGVTLLKAQMNADLLTDDLKKKRADNESFWLIGQPDVVVVSEKWLVDSMKEAVAPYEVIAKLSGVDSLEEIRSLGRDDLSLFVAITERRDLWDAVATDAGGSVDTDQRRRRPSAARNGRVSALPGRGAGLPGRIGDTGNFMRELELLSERDRRSRFERLRRNREMTDWASEIAPSLTGQLSTIHYSQATIHGFDYYNTKTGNVESGGQDKIAMWMLDPDYDGRSLFPRQVFFPMAGDEDGWTKLAKNLKAEIDTDLIEAYRGTTSLPFEPGENKRIAVKIIDDRGIESLKIIEVE